MKGVVLSINPAAQIVDITHEIPPQDIHATAFNLVCTYRDFPAGTIHVAVVDPGVGSNRRPILIECAGQFFIGPDNGLFSWICEREGNYRAIHLTNEKFFRHPISATFHGRDVFAPVAAALSNGVAPEEFGPAIEDLVQLESLKPRQLDGGLTEASIIHIDRFGNCITNLSRAYFGNNQIAAGTRLIINGREVSSFREFFSDGAANRSGDKANNEELFCVLGSAGFLEVAAQNSSAAAILRAQRGQPVLLVSGRVD